MAGSTLINRETGVAEEAGPHAIADEPALAVIDEALTAFAGRSLISGDEVVDRLLDLRSAFVAATLLRDLESADFASS